MGIAELNIVLSNVNFGASVEPMGDGSSFVSGVVALALLALSCEEHGRNG